MGHAAIAAGVIITAVTHRPQREFLAEGASSLDVEPVGASEINRLALDPEPGELVDGVVTVVGVDTGESVLLEDPRARSRASS
jgi:hypothetical protein